MVKAPDQKAVRLACIRIMARHTRDPKVILHGAMVLVAFIEGADAATIRDLSERVA